MTEKEQKEDKANMPEFNKVVERLLSAPPQPRKQPKSDKKRKVGI